MKTTRKSDLQGTFWKKPALLAAGIMLAVGYQSTAYADCSAWWATQDATVNITNDSNSTAYLYWVSPLCLEVPWGFIPAHSSANFLTKQTHVWRTRKWTLSLISETNVTTSPTNVILTDPIVIPVPVTPTTVPPSDPLNLPAAGRAAQGSPVNTPFVDPLPIPVALTPVTAPSPAPTQAANPTAVPAGRVVDAKLNGQTVATATIGGFVEAGRPDHQKWTQFGGTSTTAAGFTGDLYESVEMEVPWSFYPAVDGVPPSKVWTFVEASTGAIGPVRINAQYGRPVIHRVHNALPVENGGFGINQTSTHLHNGHTASESDGGPIQFYDAGKFKDYHYANARAGFASNVPTSTLNGRTVIGDVKETMSSLWFHDHRFDFTSQNVYKGLVSFYNLFSNDILLDTGNETTGLRLPSGEFDVPMIFGDKNFDPVTGQLAFDTGNIDGILGDKYTVNGKIQPFMNVKKRKYRFRLLDGGPSRYYEFFLSNGASFKQLSVNGNLLPSVVTTPSIRLGVAERTDVIVDFTNVAAGSKIYLQNRLEQTDGRGPTGKIIAGTNLVEFRVQAGTVADASVVPTNMLALPNKNAATVKNRTFGFTTNNGAWTVNGKFFDPNTITEFPKLNTAERWTLTSGGGWSHPAHIHYEEGQILSRNGNNILNAADIGRRDVYNIGRNVIGTQGTGTLDLFMQFRDWTGEYPIHCHNVVHEDHAMMTRFQVVP